VSRTLGLELRTTSPQNITRPDNSHAARTGQVDRPSRCSPIGSGFGVAVWPRGSRLVQEMRNGRSDAGV